VNNQYELLEQIGHGGFGDVFLAKLIHNEELFNSLRFVVKRQKEKKQSNYFKIIFIYQVKFLHFVFFFINA
jgi:serine/threonine protein kinase